MSAEYAELDGWIGSLCKARTFPNACKAAMVLNKSGSKAKYTIVQLRTRAISPGFLHCDLVPEGNPRLKASWIGLLIWNYLHVKDVPAGEIEDGVFTLSGELLAELKRRYELDTDATKSNLADTIAAKVAQDQFQESAEVAIRASAEAIASASAAGAPESPLKRALNVVESPVPASLAKLLESDSWEFGGKGYSIRKRLLWADPGVQAKLEEDKQDLAIAKEKQLNLARATITLLQENMDTANKENESLRAELQAARDKNEAMSVTYQVGSLHSDLERQRQFYEMESVFVKAYDTAYDQEIKNPPKPRAGFTPRSDGFLSSDPRDIARTKALMAAREAGYLHRAKFPIPHNLGAQKLSAQIAATADEYSMVNQFVIEISKLQNEVDLLTDKAKQQAKLTDEARERHGEAIAAQVKELERAQEQKSRLNDALEEAVANRDELKTAQRIQTAQNMEKARAKNEQNRAARDRAARDRAAAAWKTGSNGRRLVFM